VNKISRLYLARHGETLWNVEQRLQGQCDSELTENGIAQAHQLAQSSLALNLTKVYSSRLGRAEKTAKIIADKLRLSHQALAGLEERNFGQWQGRIFTSLKQEPFFEDIFNQVTDHQPPCGESAEQMVQRFTHALTAIVNRSPDKPCLVISHGDVMRCFLAKLTGRSFADAYSEFANGCLVTLDYCHEQQSFILR
jgi:broad specificity phosphatase PhoE